MKKTKGGTAAGYDYIDGRSLKTAAPIVEDALIHLVNLSIVSNTFADEWKPLIIHPRHKKGETTERKNQRPVSHIQEVGKIVERASAEQILSYMVENELMNDEQHGAMKNHSPITAIACIQDLLLQGAEEKDLTGILLIDLTAAYDTLDHEILQKKLEAYNFWNGIRSWIASYLTRRTQCVAVNGTRSDNKFLSGQHLNVF